ncbi:MAG: isocitrate/isopropylmalate family dehydrogenase [Lacunisphaera sp.]
MVSRHGERQSAEATIKLEVQGHPVHMVAEGNGPVNAFDTALRKALQPAFPQVAQIQLVDYKVRILNGNSGTGAITRVLIDWHDGCRSPLEHGRGRHQHPGRHVAGARRRLRVRAVGCGAAGGENGSFSMNAKIVLLPGDGIGPEVVNEARLVLEAVAKLFGHSFEYTEQLLGGCAIDATGTAMPDATLQACKGAQAVLLGAVGGPKWDDPQAKTRPEQGLLAIRKGLGLYANLRPVKAIPSLAKLSPLKPEKVRRR